MAKKRKRKYSRRRKGSPRRKRSVTTAVTTIKKRTKNPRGRRSHKAVYRMVRTGKVGTRKHPRRHSFSFRRVMSNPLGGLIRIPSVVELGAVAVGALALPMVTTKITDLIPVDALKGDTYGNILVELVIGTAASGAARKFASPVAGDVVFYIVLANAVRRIARKAAPGTFGMGDEMSYADLGADDYGVGYADLGEEAPEGR